MLLFFVCAAPVPCIFPDCLGLTKIALLCCTGWPNTNSLCVAGSQKYRLNHCQVLSWAHELIGNIHGLICVCGDMNASLNSFDMCRHIIAEGWQDMALASHRRFGCDLLPTCKSATRHTYGIGNPELLTMCVPKSTTVKGWKVWRALTCSLPRVCPHCFFPKEVLFYANKPVRCGGSGLCPQDSRKHMT